MKYAHDIHGKAKRQLLPFAIDNEAANRVLDHNSEIDNHIIDNVQLMICETGNGAHFGGLQPIENTTLLHMAEADHKNSPFLQVALVDSHYVVLSNILVNAAERGTHNVVDVYDSSIETTLQVLYRFYTAIYHDI